MSRIPGASPITPDIEDIRHSEDDGFFGEDRNLGDEEQDGDDDASETEEDDLDALASASVEGGRGTAEVDGWWRSA